VVDLIPPVPSTSGNQGPSFLFLFDLSFEALQSGFTQTAALSVLASISELADCTFINLVTVANVLTVYVLRHNRRIVITELDDLTVVFPSKGSVLGQVRPQLIVILTEISKLSPNAQTGNCLCVGLQASAILLQELGGIVMAFVSGASATIGPGAIPPRSKDNLLSEAALLKPSPAGPYQLFRQTAVDFSRHSISLHLFVFAASFVDLPFLSVPVSATNGKLYLYPTVSADLNNDIFRTLTTKYHWDCSLRARIGSGLVLMKIHGNGQLKDRDCVKVPILAPADSYAFELELEPHVTQGKVLFQFVLEYLDSDRRRLMRLFTFARSVSEVPAVVLSAVDEGALATVLVKRMLPILLSQGSSIASFAFAKEARRFSSLKSVPQIAFGLISSRFLRDTNAQLANRKMQIAIQLRAIGVVDTLLFCYPRLVSVADRQIRTLVSSSFAGGLLVLHTWQYVFIWAKLESDLLAEIGSGIGGDGVVDVERIDGRSAQAIREIVREAWEISARYLIVRPLVGDEAVRGYLVEDKIGEQFCYSAWLHQGQFLLGKRPA
jgi:hypothetical protein